MRILSIALATACIGLSTAVHAQLRAEFGPRLGATLSSSTFNSLNQASGGLDYTSSRSSLAGYQFGMGASLGFGHWAVQPALLFTQKGEKQSAKTSVDFFGETITQELSVSTRVNYLELPVNLVYALGEDGQGLQVFAGPYLALGVGGKSAYTSKTVSSDPNSLANQEFSGNKSLAFGNHFVEPDPNSNDDLGDSRCRRLDAGLNLGLGYRKGPVQVQATYGLGLQNTQPDYPASAHLTNETSYNRSFQLAATYFLALGGK